MSDIIEQKGWDRFDQMPLSKVMKAALDQHGFIEPTPIQRLVLPVALEKRACKASRLIRELMAVTIASKEGCIMFN